LNNKLVSDYLLVTTFWFVAAWVYFGLSSPADNLRVAQAVAALGLGFVQPPESLGEPASFMTAPGLQWYVFQAWTVLVLAVAGVLAGLGVTGTLWWLKRTVSSRTGRESADKPYAGVSISLGWMPRPQLLPMEPVSLTVLDSPPPAHQALLDEIMGVLYAHPSAFVGDGHGVDLATHTLNVIETMLDEGNRDSLAIVCAAAHDLGKITSYQKTKSGEWLRVKKHDKESARLVATLPAFMGLAEIERQALTFALAYSHDLASMPEGDGSDLARRILTRTKKADNEATKQEKARVLEAMPLPEMVLRAFLEVLPTIPLQSPGLPKKVPAAGWRVGQRAWFLEWRVREEAMRKLPPDVRAAMGGDWRDKHRPAPYMIELLKVLAEQGWLVQTYEQWTCEPENALWRIRAGIKEFNGVFAVDLPAVHLMKLPAETAYALEVLGPQMALQAGTPVSDFGEVGLFKPGPAKPAPRKEAAPVAPPKAPEPESPPVREAVSEPSNESVPVPDETPNPVEAPVLAPEPIEPLPAQAPESAAEPEAPPFALSTYVVDPERGPISVADGPAAVAAPPGPDSSTEKPAEKPPKRAKEETRGPKPAKVPGTAKPGQQKHGKQGAKRKGGDMDPMNMGLLR
jgi:hypothetical protein